jgi:hypothetical protein
MVGADLRVRPPPALPGQGEGADTQVRPYPLKADSSADLQRARAA